MERAGAVQISGVEVPFLIRQSDPDPVPSVLFRYGTELAGSFAELLGGFGFTFRSLREQYALVFIY